MKTAVIQLSAGPDKAANISKAVMFVEKAFKKGARLAVLPEVFHYRGGVESLSALSGIKEAVSGQAITALKNLARAYNADILAGSIYEAVAGQPKAYNTSVLINGKGRVVARYRKIHLFRAKVGGISVSEARLFRAGDRPAMAKVGGFNVGLSVCYDLRFPELYRYYRQKGAHVLCVPSAFTQKTGMYHWEVLLRARAIENMCYVLAPNQCGPDGRGVTHYGHSMIVDPWGKILARASGKSEEILFARLDKNIFNRYSKVLPSIRKG